MAKRRDPSAQYLIEAVKLLSKLPPKVLIPLLLVGVVVVVIVVLSLRNSDTEKPSNPRFAGPPGTYLFCSWNVENFYNDSDEPNIHDKLEDWFGESPDMFRLKVEHLADALLWMNDGNGPDIMALYEVENLRCMNALKDVLNERLTKNSKADFVYENMLFVGDNTGRHFAPGMLTRLPVEKDRTHRFGNRYNTRALEGHFRVNGHGLVILAAHWTSRVERGGKGGEAHANASRRMNYAEDQYGRFREILTANPEADVIMCGDFNDEFTDPSMQQGLRASASVDEVRNAVAEPRSLALFANWPATADPPGSIYGRGKWSIFDHICISRGLLDDRGWTCEESSASIFAPKELRMGKRGEPFRFGDAKAREHGYSDHFPVTVRLRVVGSGGP